MGKRYGQYCGLARAAEVVGERWTLLILRDLSVGPARFLELKTGLPGIAASVLSERLGHLESDGLIARSSRPSVASYHLTVAGESLAPVLRALSLWGASTMDHPHEGEQVTDRSLAAMLATTRTSRRVTPFVVEIRGGLSVAHATVTATRVHALPGPVDQPDLVLSGPGLRQMLAQPDRVHDLLTDGALTAKGASGALEQFTQAFSAPLRRSV